MMRPRQGEVWWALLPQPIGRRPAVILTRDSVIERRTNVTVAPVTRTIHGIGTEVPLSRADGLITGCVVNLDSILTISKDRLERRMVRLPPQKMRQVFDAIRFAFAMP